MSDDTDKRLTPEMQALADYCETHFALPAQAERPPCEGPHVHWAIPTPDEEHARFEAKVARLRELLEDMPPWERSRVETYDHTTGPLEYWNLDAGDTDDAAFTEAVILLREVATVLLDKLYPTRKDTP